MGLREGGGRKTNVVTRDAAYGGSRHKRRATRVPAPVSDLALVQLASLSHVTATYKACIFENYNECRSLLKI